MPKPRKYPSELTSMQRQMLRDFARDHHYPYDRTAKRLTRFEKLRERGYLVRHKSGSGWTPAPNLRKEVTYFVQEEGPAGFVKVSLSSQSGIVPRLQAGNPRKLKLLGAFEGDCLAKIEAKIAEHLHARGGWYKPHADVLAWTKHKDFRKA